MKKISLLFLIALVMVGCAGAKRYTRDSVVIDKVFSVDARGSGTAYALWWANDSIAIYCFTNPDMYQGIKTMIQRYPGVQAKGNYHGDGTPVETSPCYNIESSSVASQTFELENVELFICDRWFGWKPDEQIKADQYAKDRNWPACNLAVEK